MMTDHMKEGAEVRRIDLSGCREMGHGQCAGIYRLSGDRAAKIFFDTIPEESIRLEYERTCEAYNLGVHSVQCFGLVRWQNRLGIELAWLEGEDLKTLMRRSPELSGSCGRQMGEELRLLHTKVPNAAFFPPIHDFYLHCVDGCLRDGWITAGEAELIGDCIRAIPVRNTMIHGDFHSRNLIAGRRGLTLIDMADCMSGHPVFDLLITNLYLHFIPLHTPALFERFYGSVNMTREQLFACWDQFVRTYFGTEDEDEIRRIDAILDVYSMLKLILAPYSFSNMKEEEYGNIVSIGRRFLMEDIRAFTGVIPADVRQLGKE